MLYKEFEKKLKQKIEITCSKYVNTKLGNEKSFFHNLSSINDEITSELNEFIKEKLKYCEISSKVFHGNIEMYVVLKTKLLFRLHTDFIRLVQISLKVDTDTKKTEIISINYAVNRVTVYYAGFDEIFFTGHPYLKSYQNKKIKMLDDVTDITEKLHNEVEKQYKAKYFNLLSFSTEAALELYLNHVLKHDFTSQHFCLRVSQYDCVLNPRTVQILMENDEMNSVRKDLNELLMKKRIYSAAFEVFENGEKIKEYFFSSLPMSQIRYYHTYLKDSFYEAIHTPACGTALIRMTITNVFTGKVKTVDDSFCY